jgi:acetyl-CoA carboxylase biotin carboxyl carrier protein
MQARKKKATSFREATLQYSLTYRDVVDILRLFKDADHCETVELAVGDLRLKFRRSAAQSKAAAATSPVPAAVTPQREARASKPMRPPTPLANERASPGSVIAAPMLGTFYHAPEPGAKPFVDIGSVVAKGDTIGLIEVMKLFSPVSADVAGTVVEILADNGALVEYGQPLVRLKPASAATPPLGRQA